MKEDRLDRIEKEMSEFLLGMKEMRAFQKETGEQIEYFLACCHEINYIPSVENNKEGKKHSRHCHDR